MDFVDGRGNKALGSKTIGANETCISVTKVYIGSASLSIYNGIRIQENVTEMVSPSVQNFLCARESVSLPVYMSHSVDNGSHVTSCVLYSLYHG